MKRAAYNYEALRTAAADLIQKKNELDQQLTEMRNMIANMVSGDFKTTQASGKLNEVYAQFTDKATKTLETLQRTSDFLKGIIAKQEEVEGSTTDIFTGLNR
jgi:uncharacterized protein YukE